MNERQIQTIVQALLLGSLLVVAAVLGWGIVDGRLRPGAAQVRAGGGQSSGLPTGSTGSFSSAGTVDGLVMLSAEGLALAVVDPASGELRAQRALSRQVRALTPTPGGVSVWVTYVDSPEIDVFDTTALEREATVIPPGGGGRTPEYLTFSDTGELLFVTWAESDVVSAYTHSMRELSLRGEYDASGTTGRIVRNRRASRLFRRDTSEGGFGVFFAQNGQRMGTVGEGSSAQPVAVGFDGRYEYLLVGSGGTEDAVVVSERDGSARAIAGVRLSAEVRPRAVSVDSNLVAALSHDGERVVIVDAAQAAVVAEHELPGRIAGLHVLGNGHMVLIAETGALFRIEPDNPGSPVLVGTVSLPSGFADGVGAVSGFSIQPQGNFACF